MCGKLTDERFTKLSAGYEQEQTELAASVQTLRSELGSGAGAHRQCGEVFETRPKVHRAKRIDRCDGAGVYRENHCPCAG